MTSMQEKVAVITGGMRGLGFAIADQLTSSGATVIITDVNQQGLDGAVAALGAGSSGVLADVTDQAVMNKVFADVAQQHGRVDVVIANAGVGRQTRRSGRSPGNTSTRSTASTSRASCSPFRVPAPPRAAPARCILGYRFHSGPVRDEPVRRLEGGPARADPGLDPGSQGHRRPHQHPQPRRRQHPVTAYRLRRRIGTDHVNERVKTMGEGNPIGRLVQPSEIAKAVQFLASDDSSGVTGVELFVNGGVAQTG